MGMIWGNTKPPLGTPINWSHPLSRGIVGCWLMNEGMGDKVNDLSGNKNTGTLVGMSHPATPTSGWNPGKFGKTLSFNVNNSNYVDLGFPNLLASINPYTVSIWAKSFSFTNYQNIYYCGGGAAGRYGIIIFSTGEWMAECRIGGTPSGVSGGILTLNTWNNFVITFGGTTISVYLNGILKNVVTNATIETAANKIVIGADFSGGGFRYFNGMVDNFIIYNRVLTAKQILQLSTEPFCVFNN